MSHNLQPVACARTGGDTALASGRPSSTVPLLLSGGAVVDEVVACPACGGEPFILGDRPDRLSIRCAPCNLEIATFEPPAQPTKFPQMLLEALERTA